MKILIACEEKEAHLLLAEKAETASTDNSTCAASALRIH